MQFLKWLLFLSAFSAALPAAAQRVFAVKVDRVLITMDNLNFQPQQVWESLDEKGLPTGEVLILQTREEKAVGQIKSGYVVADAVLRLKSEPPPKEPFRRRRLFVGLSSLDATIKVRVVDGVDEANSNLKGSLFGLQAGADQLLSPHQVLRFRFGMDLIDATGGITNPPGCEDTDTCTFRIHYFTGSLGFLWQLFGEGHPWNAGLNTSFVGLLPVSKTSNALNESNFNLDGGFEFGGVLHFKINPITWIELSAQRLFLRESNAFAPTLYRYNITWMQNF